MQVLNTFPPIYDEANKLFKLEENHICAVFTYGDVLHNPFNVELDPELVRHEETHMEQQEAHPEVAAMWWKRYLQDQDFRIDQECEAYGAQYKLFCQRNKDRNKQARYLFALAQHLSGPMYGKAIDRASAMQRIKETAEHPLG